MAEKLGFNLETLMERTAVRVWQRLFSRHNNVS